MNGSKPIIWLDTPNVLNLNERLETQRNRQRFDHLRPIWDAYIFKTPFGPGLFQVANRIPYDIP